MSIKKEYCLGLIQLPKKCFFYTTEIIHHKLPGLYNHNSKLGIEQLHFSLANVGELINDADSVHGGTADSFRNNSSTSVAEVLDITHDQNDPFTLHFDDTDWYKHLNSLKPLGLAILLNTCNMKTQVIKENLADIQIS